MKDQIKNIVDERISSKVPEVSAMMKKHNETYDYKIYDGAGHAFFNDTGTATMPKPRKMPGQERSRS